MHAHDSLCGARTVDVLFNGVSNGGGCKPNECNMLITITKFNKSGHEITTLRRRPCSMLYSVVLRDPSTPSPPQPPPPPPPAAQQLLSGPCWPLPHTNDDLSEGTFLNLVNGLFGDVGA